jgi:hypothetical protein
MGSDRRRRYLHHGPLDDGAVAELGEEVEIERGGAASLPSRNSCGHKVELDPAEMAARYGADTPVPDWRERLVCSGCGGRQADMVVTGTERRHLMDADIEKRIEFLSRKTQLGPSTILTG